MTFKNLRFKDLRKASDHHWHVRTCTHYFSLNKLEKFNAKSSMQIKVTTNVTVISLYFFLILTIKLTSNSIILLPYNFDHTE